MMERTILIYLLPETASLLLFSQHSIQDKVKCSVKLCGSFVFESPVNSGVGFQSLN